MVRQVAKRASEARACPPFIATTARCIHVAYTDGADDGAHVTSDDR